MSPRTGWLIAWITMSLAAAPLVAQERGRRPDIVLVVLDDLGFSDLGCYGGEIDTPNIDRLAAGGLRFTRFYNAARCCPTRASLMTGLYPHQVGLQRNGQSLTRDGVTIAEALQLAGYQTAMSGKWHLSKTHVLTPPERHMRWINHQIDPPNQPFGPPESYPARRGFERFYGIIWGVVDYFDPFSLVEGMQPVKEVPNDFYITDAITDHAVQYVREADPAQPLFLYVAHCAPHWPLHARLEDIQKYRGRFTDGWHAMRQRRYKKQVEMGLIDPQTHPLPELMGRGQDWAELTEAERAMESAKMQVHATMIDRVDQGIGEVIRALTKAGRYENTVLFVLADNGASPEAYPNPGYDRSSRTRDGEPIRYRGFRPEELGRETTYTGIGPRWASAANTPFRYWKRESFEGGMHAPLIVHWPEGLKTAAGSMTDQAGHVMDILPTCLDLAGADYPERYQGHAIRPLEGESLGPILRGGQRDGHAALYFEHDGGKAVIDDGWKLVQPVNGKTWELYHLEADRTETKNLADAEPVRATEMVRQWTAWAERVGVQNRK
jgi:arylsulfatase